MLSYGQIAQKRGNQIFAQKSLGDSAHLYKKAIGNPGGLWAHAEKTGQFKPMCQDAAGEGGKRTGKNVLGRWDYGESADFHRKNARFPPNIRKKAPFLLVDSAQFPLVKLEKMVGNCVGFPTKTRFLQKLYEKRTDKVRCATGFYPRRRCSKK